ncbi:ATP-binding protein [Pyxidicoccus caerfyrddinensis]|uniref:hybrid sensor histidine kinase/response regulator n=1 Tax=Pyxidicoccus caerfyrddinensis TaxID=2709663 RepID=UPI0013DBC9B4|nr:ATP-binding protein [Pyxidicoccus caerfyrddinensis]
MSAAIDVRGVTSPGASPAVLLVEDSAADAVALQRALQPLGVALVCVTSGEDAVQALERQDFVAVLLDVFLAGAWDGFETARRIRETPGHQALPLLFMTGSAQDALLTMRAYRAGAVDFLHKPLFAEQLTAKVSVFLELWQSRERERTDLRAREAHALQRAEAERQRVDVLNAALVAHQEWLQSVLQWLPVPLILVERDTARILFANTKADDYWGTTFPRAMSEGDYARAFSLVDLTGRELAPSEYPAVRASRGESISGLQLLARTPRGQRAVLVDTAQVPALGERPACAVVTFQDITLLKEAELALRKREEAHRFLAEASALLGNSLDSHATLQLLARLAVPTLADWCTVDVLDERGRVEHIAVAHADPERARSLHDFLRNHPHPPDAHRGVARVLRTGEPDWMAHIPEDALRGSTWGGAERRDMLRTLGIRSYLIVPLIAGGRVLGTLSLMQAESGRHYTEEDVRVAEDLARRAALAVDNARLYQASQQAVRLRDEFLSVASHELRTPLTPIRIKVQALQRHTQAAPGGVLPSDKVASVLDTVSMQTRRLGRLVDALLDVSQFSAGRLEIHREPVDLAALMHEVAASFEADCAKAGCRLDLHVPGTVVGTYDRRRVEQVVSHLLANAVKYGAGRPIHLRLEADGGSARLTVRDEGIGISPEALPRLFGKFERAVSERHYGGLGLGLYLAREIVEAHGGTIRVESQPGLGACFEVALPLDPILS